MSRYRGPKNRIARKFGVNIFTKLRNPLLHKANPPGVHGAKRKKQSDYGVQLFEKQKLKAVYGMLTNKQLILTYKKALKKHGNTANILLSLLECRLDNIVYRARFASTIFGAQQLISHGHITVNGKKTDIRSCLVKPSDKISLKEKSKKLKIVQSSIANLSREIPDYMSLEEDKLTATLISEPEADQIPLPLDINTALVCEFLAHTF